MFQKKIILLFLFFGLQGSAQLFFEKYIDKEGVETMVMDQKMFQLLSLMDISTSDKGALAYVQLIQNINKLKILTTGKSTYRKVLRTDITEYVPKVGLLLQSTKVSPEKEIRLFSKPGRQEGFVSELLLVLHDLVNTSEPKTTVVSLTGNIDMSQLFRLAQNLDIPGSEIFNQP